MINLACTEKVQKDIRYPLTVVHDERLRRQILPELIKHKAQGQKEKKNSRRDFNRKSASLQMNKTQLNHLTRLLLMIYGNNHMQK